MDHETTAKKQRVILENIFDFLEIAMVALILVAVLFAFFIRIVGVEGDSMSNTLAEGDRLILTKVLYTPACGDIVVINRDGDTPLIKRVIAVENQTIEFDETNNRVLVDGVAIDEPYLSETCRTFANDIDGPVTVPEGHVFVMGDNRSYSLDSRMPSRLGCENINGCISVDHIIGKAVLRFLPFDKFGTV